MQNPAANLLKPKIQEKPKIRKAKINFLILAIILAFFVVVGLFFDRGVWQQRRDSASQAAIARFLPTDTQVLVWLNLNLEQNSDPSRLFALYDRYAVKVGRPQAADQLKEFLNVLPEDIAANLFNQSQEFAWARLGSAESAASEVAILKLKAGRAEDVLQANLPSENIGQSDVPFYYFSDGQYLFFSASPQGIKAISDLASSDNAETLESFGRFKRLEKSFYTSSPFFVYLNLGEGYPDGARISEIKGNNISLETYYNKTQDQIKETGSAWLRLMPKEPILVLSGAGGNVPFLFNLNNTQSFADLTWHFLDPDGSLRERLANEKADFFLSSQNNLELIVSLDSNQNPATTLILGNEGKNAENFDRLTQFFQGLAAWEEPQEENTILADGSKITEYVLADNLPLPGEIRISGIAFQTIDLNPKRHLFYGCLDNYLIISDSEEALAEIIASFRRPRSEALVFDFSGGLEWFYFDFEKMGNFSQADSGLGLKKLQGASYESNKGLVVKIKLGI